MEENENSGEGWEGMKKEGLGQRRVCPEKDNVCCSGGQAENRHCMCGFEKLRSHKELCDSLLYFYIYMLLWPGNFMQFTLQFYC